MAILPILCYPDPRLRVVAKPVVHFDDSLQATVADMAQTMYEAPGVGLAATQVDIHLRIIVMDVSDARNDLLVFNNPELLWVSEEKKLWNEGCLSEPDFFAEFRLIPNALFLRRTLGRTFLGFSCRFTRQQAGSFGVFRKELAKLGDVDFSVG